MSLHCKLFNLELLIVYLTTCAYNNLVLDLDELHSLSCRAVEVFMNSWSSVESPIKLLRTGDLSVSVHLIIAGGIISGSLRTI